MVAIPRQLRDFVRAESVAWVLTDPRQPDNPIVRCSEKFLEMTGYDREEVIGRNCRFLRGTDTQHEPRAIIRNAIESEAPAVVELINYRKDGTPFLNSLMIAPIHDENSCLVGYLGTQMEVPGEREAFVKKREKWARKLIKNLTPRQSQILARIARGAQVKQIAHELGLVERTVKMHRKAMVERLGVRTTAEAIRIAVRGGL